MGKALRLMPENSATLWVSTLPNVVSHELLRARPKTTNKEENKMKDRKLVERYLKTLDFTKESGFAINTEEMNPENWDEVFFHGESLQ